MPAARLRVELTESAVMADPAAVLDVLTRLAISGVRIAIDDLLGHRPQRVDLKDALDLRE